MNLSDDTAQAHGRNWRLCRWTILKLQRLSLLAEKIGEAMATACESAAITIQTLAGINSDDLDESPSREAQP